MNSFHKKYQEEVIAKIMASSKIDNKMAVPRFEKVALNVGLSKAEKDQNFIENVTKIFAILLGKRQQLPRLKKQFPDLKFVKGKKWGCG